MSKTKELTRQLAQDRRGSLERKRKKKFNHLKNTGGFKNYLNQKAILKAGLKVVKKRTRSSQGSGIPKVSRWQRFINFIKKLFKISK